jgi:hypothetical protein
MFNLSKRLIILCKYPFTYISAIFLLITFPASGQNNSTVTFYGIGEIKLGMEKTELEKLLKEPIAVPNISSDKAGVYKEDTIHIIYKGVDIDIMLQPRWSSKNNEIQVVMIKSNCASLITKSGIGIGDNMLKILSTYKDYSLHIYPYYDDYTVRVKGKSSIHLTSSEGSTSIIFYLTDEKVTGFGLNFIEAD